MAKSPEMGGVLMEWIKITFWGRASAFPLCSGQQRFSKNEI
jgi:hypothetical protein